MYPSDNETQLWVTINLAQRTVFRAIDAALKAKGLPPLLWYDVLWSMERASRDGVRPFELEKLLLHEQSNLSRLFRRMTEMGLTEASVCPQDRRGRIFRITKKGREVRKKMWAIYGPLMHHHMVKVGDDGKLGNLVETLKPLRGIQLLSS